MIKIIVDCCSTIGTTEAKELGLISLPMRMCFGEQEFLAGENLSDAKFYELLAAAKTPPKTMLVNQNDYVDVIKPLLDAGDEVFAMSISSGLSGTFNSLRLASEQLNSPHLKIFDTQTFTIGYYALVKEALKLVAQGVTLDELEKRMLVLRDKVQIYTIIDNMKYLIRGGRISFAKGMVAWALHIKPIIGVRDGKLSMVGKAIGYNAAKKQMGRLVANLDQSLPIYYGHANASEKAEDFKATFPTFNFVEKREIGPIIAAHGGPGCVGLAFFEK